MLYGLFLFVLCIFGMGSHASLSHLLCIFEFFAVSQVCWFGLNCRRGTEGMRVLVALHTLPRVVVLAAVWPASLECH